MNADNADINYAICRERDTLGCPGLFILAQPYYTSSSPLLSESSCESDRTSACHSLSHIWTWPIEKARTVELHSVCESSRVPCHQRPPCLLRDTCSHWIFFMITYEGRGKKMQEPWRLTCAAEQSLDKYFQYTRLCRVQWAAHCNVQCRSPHGLQTRGRVGLHWILPEIKWFFIIKEVRSR
ncbi:hypothetical protein BC827DRAFT_853393 [Russula dissimulans]|nr:hypothetical protein BC827DRAFT_853393 [Russula dissimulans]